MGGQQEHDSPQASVFAYAIATDGWEELTPLPEPHHSAVGGMVGDRLYFSTGGTAKSWMGIPVVAGGSDSGSAAAAAVPGPASLFFCSVVEPRACGTDCATGPRADLW